MKYEEIEEDLYVVNWKHIDDDNIMLLATDEESESKYYTCVVDMSNRWLNSIASEIEEAGEEYLRKAELTVYDGDLDKFEEVT